MGLTPQISHSPRTPPPPRGMWGVIYPFTSKLLSILWPSCYLKSVLGLIRSQAAVSPTFFTSAYNFYSQTKGDETSVPTAEGPRQRESLCRYLVHIILFSFYYTWFSFFCPLLVTGISSSSREAAVSLQMTAIFSLQQQPGASVLRCVAPTWGFSIDPSHPFKHQDEFFNSFSLVIAASCHSVPFIVPFFFFFSPRSGFNDHLLGFSIEKTGWSTRIRLVTHDCETCDSQAWGGATKNNF